MENTKNVTSWKNVTLREICERVESVKRKEKHPNEQFLYLDIGGIDNLSNKIVSHKNYNWGNAPSRAQQIVLVGDILFSTVRTYMKNIAMVETKNYDKQIASSGFCIVRVDKKLATPKFIFHYLTSQSFLQPLNELQTGSSYPAVRDKDVFSQPLTLPSLHTQQAIVSKIEELFSELDKGIENLLTVQQQLTTYRHSVLKWAFEGKLTSVKIIEEELPNGWKWVSMNDVCYRIGDIDHKMPKQQSSGFPYVSTKDFTDDLKISFENVKYVSENDYINLSRKIKPENGDIIFPRYGTIGKNILVDFDKEFLVSYSCAVIKPNRNIVLSKYLYLYSLSPKISSEIKKYVVETTQANIGIASIKKFVFPLPNMKEQIKVVQAIERLLSIADKMQESITRSLQQAAALRQSILKKAFEGKLVTE